MDVDEFGKNLREVHLNVKMWVLLFVDKPTVLLNNWLVNEGYVEYGCLVYELFDDKCSVAEYNSVA